MRLKSGHVTRICLPFAVANSERVHHQAREKRHSRRHSTVRIAKFIGTLSILSLSDRESSKIPSINITAFLLTRSKMKLLTVYIVFKYFTKNLQSNVVPVAALHRESIGL